MAACLAACVWRAALVLSFGVTAPSPLPAAETVPAGVVSTQEGASDTSLEDHKAAEDAVKAAADAVKAAADLTKPGASPEASPAAEVKCKAILDTATDEWCATTCATSYCPPTACECA